MDVTSVTNAHLFLIFGPGNTRHVLDHARVASIFGLEELTHSWGQTDSGSSRHPDVCGPSSLAKIPIGASTAGGFWFFKLWTKKQDCCPLMTVHVLVAVTARKQLFLKMDHNLHPHSLNGQSLLPEAQLRNHLSLFIPCVTQEQGCQAGAQPHP